MCLSVTGSPGDNDTPEANEDTDDVISPGKSLTHHLSTLYDVPGT